MIYDHMQVQRKSETEKGQKRTGKVKSEGECVCESSIRFFDCLHEFI